MRIFATALIGGLAGAVEIHPKGGIAKTCEVFRTSAYIGI